MRTTVKFIFRPSKCRIGTGTLTLRIIRNRVTRIISTPYLLSPCEWDGVHQKVVVSNNTLPKRKRELAIISGKIKKDRQLVLDMAAILEYRGDYSSTDLANNFREQQQGILFCEYINRKVKKLKDANRFGTAHALEYSVLSFLKFLENRDIRFDSINSVLIKNYERYLQQNGKSRNTISSYIRPLRASYNEILNEKIFIVRRTKSNPFSGVFTGNAKTQKRAITAGSISRLMEVKPHPENSLALSRDLFLFSLFTQGMTFSDTVNLKKENIEGDILLYNRKKTGQRITVKLESYTKAIIDRYVVPHSDYIFPILREYENSNEFARWKAINSTLAIYNRNLNRLAKMAGIDGHLTGYVSRHTWASLASQEGTSIATISKGMGHESEKTTRIYVAQLNYSDVEEANKKILSLLTKNTLAD